MASQAPAKTTLFYLYVGSEWSGPFQVEQIRFFRRHGQVESDTYAYDPDQQRHYTVGELLSAVEAPAESGHGSGSAHPLVPPELDEASTPSTTRIFLSNDNDEAEATATLGTSLDALPEPLAGFYRTFRSLTEGHPSDREQTLAHLVEIGSSIGIQLSAAVNDSVSLTLLVGDLLRLADYLANRHQDAGLWEAIDVLRSHRPEIDAEEAISAGRFVVGCLVDRARRGSDDHPTPGLMPTVAGSESGNRPNVTPDLTDSQEIKAVTDSWDQPHARTARAILRDARKELRSTEADLGAIQKAYAELQEMHTRDLDEAREMLARLESERADESANAAQALAEVRSLAAEIHRLAEEHLSSEQDLKSEIIRLAEELKGSDATAMAPLAEALLIRLVTRLRTLARAPGQDQADVTLLREELASARGELVQARAQVLVLTDERDRLKRQLDEQRAAADRAITNAKEREQRLRSTVTALEVTKDLHQDVMRELEVQLTGAQRRVSEMEGELSTVRVELNKTRTNLSDRTKELQDEMRRAVELRALLEARREELSVNLKDAEAQLEQAQTVQAGESTAQDPELMEALAVKVNHLRTMFEATKKRLDEQEGVATKLEEELGASRREASQLRGRSDSLNNELDDARTGLAAAKKRFEELNRAYARLESEREALQHELLTRKGTDSLRKSTDTVRRSADEAGRSSDRPSEHIQRPDGQNNTMRVSRVVEQLEARVGEITRKLEHANSQLEGERQRVRELTLVHEQLQVRVEDLTADRDQVRSELDRLHSESFSEHSRHAAALAVSTQSAIEAERRLKETISRMVELEEQVVYLQANQQPPDAALSQLTVEGEDGAASPEQAQPAAPNAQLEELQRQLEQAHADLARQNNASAAAQSEQRERLTERLGKADAELSEATAARDDASTLLRSTIAERDRVGRELGRLKNEHESAAVEHRASLKSARDKLGEAQARIQVLERELEAARQGDTKVAEQTAALSAERDRLGDEVRTLRAQLERGDASGDLAGARRELEQELERIRALTRSLGETQQQSDAARARVTALEAQAGSAQGERDHLLIEIERLKGELLMAQAAAGASHENDVGRRQQLEYKLREVLNDREQMLSELSRVNAELMTVRGRLVRAESEAIVSERLPREHGRVLDLEAQIVQLRTESAGHISALSEVRSQLAVVTAERDRWHSEAEQLRQLLLRQPGTSQQLEELAQLRDKLSRAKQRIRELRRERDALWAGSGANQAETRPTGRPPVTGFTSSQMRPVAPTMAPTGMIQATMMPTSMAATGAFRQAEAEEGGFVSALAQPAVNLNALEPTNPLFAGSGGTARVTHSQLPPTSRLAQEASLRYTTLVAQRTAPHRWRGVGRGVLLLGGGLAAVGLAGIASGIWLYQLPTRSLHGWVNADLITIRSPLDGRIASSQVPLRSTPRPGTSLVTVVNPDPDRHDLDLLNQHLKDAELRLSALQIERDGIRHRTTVQPLVVNLMPVQDTFRGRPSPVIIAMQPHEADSPVELAAIERDIAGVERDIAGFKARVPELEARIAALRQAEVRMPVEGLVLSVAATEGKWVKAGDALMAISDSTSLAVDATFPASSAAKLQPGTEVEVFLGDDRKVITATISAITTQPTGETPARVIDLGQLPEGSMRIRISLMTQADPSLVVGQPARVMVTGPDLPFLTSLGVALRQRFWH